MLLSVPVSRLSPLGHSFVVTVKRLIAISPFVWTGLEMDRGAPAGGGRSAREERRLGQNDGAIALIRGVARQSGRPSAHQDCSSVTKDRTCGREGPQTANPFTQSVTSFAKRGGSAACMAWAASG